MLLHIGNCVLWGKQNKTKQPWLVLYLSTSGSKAGTRHEGSRNTMKKSETPVLEFIHSTNHI